MCSTPAILTSIGQSADVDIANTLCTKAGIEVTMNKNITGADLPDDCKTLILAVGGSSKDLVLPVSMLTRSLHVLTL